MGEKIDFSNFSQSTQLMFRTIFSVLWDHNKSLQPLSGSLLPLGPVLPALAPLAGGSLPGEASFALYTQ